MPKNPSKSEKSEKSDKSGIEHKKTDLDIDIDIGYASSMGLKNINEDFLAAMLPNPDSKTELTMGGIVALADGVSTGGMGKEAAQTTAACLVRDYFSTPAHWDTTVALDRLIRAQNTWLFGVNHQRRQQKTDVLGLTTLTALVVKGSTYTLAHVGDCRCFLYRHQSKAAASTSVLLQLTTDHVVNHPDLRHQLLRAVGLQDDIVVDYSQGKLEVGDVFLLLTDGVHGSVGVKKIKAILDASFLVGSAVDLPNEVDPKNVNATDVTDEYKLQRISEKLTQTALQSGSKDNVTVVVVQVHRISQTGLKAAQQHANSLPVLPKMKVGDVLDGYSVTSVVADSGINILYQVRDNANQHLYALKTLHPSRAHDEQERAMLVHESWLGQQMEYTPAGSNLVKIRTHDAVCTDIVDRKTQSIASITPTAFYVVFDWHSGETLQQRLQKITPPTLTESIDYTTAIVRTLCHLHRHHIVHRDIKPANLHLGNDGKLRVLDLGVALSGFEPDALRDLHAGSPSYINPEQWGVHVHGNSDPQGGNDDKWQADAGSDLFATGVTLYQLLTSKLPYGEVLPNQIGRYYKDPTPPSRHNPAVPIWLENITLKAIARDARQRFETAEEFLLALERGASRPLHALPSVPLLQQDPTVLWKIMAGVSLLFNGLLIYWLLFLPK